MKYECHLNDIFVKDWQFICKYTLQSNVYKLKVCIRRPSSKAWAELLFNLLVWDTFLFKWVNVFVTDTKYVLTSLTICTVYHSYSNPFGREINCRPFR